MSRYRTHFELQCSTLAVATMLQQRLETFLGQQTWGGALRIDTSHESQLPTVCGDVYHEGTRPAYLTVLRAQTSGAVQLWYTSHLAEGTDPAPVVVSR